MKYRKLSKNDAERFWELMNQLDYRGYINLMPLIKAGGIIFLVMQLVSCFGYMLFPLSNDKTERKAQRQLCFGKSYLEKNLNNSCFLVREMLDSI